ncbi:TIGR01777 family protein [Kaistella flava (ex Peng et al. 2021)]|uniref:TIGR01777 family protein n=1 Tax=Kaistella flava (ex Peng et al. 2021) TaxID=2038776 RepID=A0A7M2Y5Y1_9FLAO|nr:TIGR01777 family oxidoreductase [Kaistella flava (ex Peng et al. 2021)]QOW09249.1 TIGR01777 family protein [Kaistella flava (ex Peng et al. 2021)]
MNILITGGTGLVGSSLVKKLQEHQHIVRILTRSKSEEENEFYWNVAEKEIDDKAFENLDCIIHLAGANISERWTDDYKKELYSSRIDSANLLFDYCGKKAIHLKSFISSSGINYYGTFTSDQILTEESGIVHNDFLAKLCDQWENAADQFSKISDRVVCLRTAVVLSKKGGAFPMLKKTVDLNIASGVGSGKQWMNWIHIDDLVNIYVTAVENSAMNGKYNAVADEVPTNKEFMKKLAKAANKFFLPFNVPIYIMKSIFGEMSSIILEGTRADNKKIKSQGFDFKYAELDKAFKNLL